MRNGGPCPFGGTPAGNAGIWTLENAAGTRLCLTDYGARVVSLSVRNGDGGRRELVLGLPDAGAYAADKSYLGAVCGRFANRIAGAGFTLDGVRYALPANDGNNCLHGGPDGYDRRLWAADRPSPESVRFSIVSPDGDQGFPGALRASVTYELTEGNEVRIRYAASADAATPVNLTNHTYFNLDGDASVSALRHRLRLFASAFLPVGKDMIPTGERVPGEGTPFDFRSERQIGERIGEEDAQLAAGSGYDHCYILDGTAGSLHPCAALTGENGIRLVIETTMPGVQLYSGNWLPARRRGVALETQMFPDSPNRPEFPDCVVRPGEEMRSETVWRIERA